MELPDLREMSKFRQRACLVGSHVWQLVQRSAISLLAPLPAAVREEMLRLRAAVAFHAGRHAQAHRLLSRSLRIAEGNDTRLSQGLSRMARSRVRAVLGWPGARFDQERGAALLEEIGGTAPYHYRTEGWLA